MTANRRVQLSSAGGFLPAVVAISALLLSGCWGGPSIGPRIGSKGRDSDDTVPVTKEALPQAHSEMAGSGAQLDAPDAGMGDEPSAPVDHPQPPEPRPVPPSTADDSVHCGNGVVDDTELCDIAIADGDPGACPAACKTDACHPQALEIRGCMSRCVPVEPGANCEMKDL
jgi:hypothetical protein